MEQLVQLSEVVALEEGMRRKKISVYGLFSNGTALSLCVERLKIAGFLNTDISCLMPDRTGNQDIGTEKSTKAPEGSATGTATGVVLGGTIGWLAGVGILAIPGVGPLIAAGPIMASLAGAGLGAAIGGVSGALIGFGIPEYEAKRFEGLIRQGKILLSVHCDTSESIDLAKEIMDACGAADVSAAKEASVSTDKYATDVDPTAYSDNELGSTELDIDRYLSPKSASYPSAPSKPKSVPPTFPPTIS